MMQPANLFSELDPEVQAAMLACGFGSYRKLWVKAPFFRTALILLY